MVAGAQKSGTRALRHFLAQHPDIGLSREERPEPHFFDSVEGSPGQLMTPETYQKYHDLFTPEALSKVTGDITPRYLYDTGSLARIRAYNSAMKIVVLLRNPIDRAYSQWNMEVARGRERRAFLPALMHEWRVYHTTGQHAIYSYVQRGFYDGQIARLQSLFPPDQYLVLRTENLRDNHNETMRKVFAFLEVSATENSNVRAGA